MRVVIVGGGISGLALALMLEQRSIECTVCESAPEIKALGVGLSLLPHGTRQLTELGLLDSLEETAVAFQESCFYNRHGQLIYVDPADPRWPQFLIHRADLHRILLDAVIERLGSGSIQLNHQCVGVRQNANGAVASFETIEGSPIDPVAGDIVIGCDGVHSAVRATFYPQEGDLTWSGINLWRGVTRTRPFLSGGSHVRIGVLDSGKLVVYPIRTEPDGSQLVNWVAEVRSSRAAPVAWSQPGRLEDFAHLYEDWHFDWLDVPRLLEQAELILEYPMSDRDPVGKWSFGRVTLVGDAAHPMLPRGSNGAMQAILDARALADALHQESDPESALRRYEDERLEVVNRIVLTNRTTPPDHLIQVVTERTGDRPFERREAVIDDDEVRTLLDSYKETARYSAGSLASQGGKD